MESSIPSSSPSSASSSSNSPVNHHRTPINPKSTSQAKQIDHDEDSFYSALTSQRQSAYETTNLYAPTNRTSDTTLSREQESKAMLGSLYVKKLDMIVEKAQKLSTRLGNSVRRIAASELGTHTFRLHDEDVVTKLTTSKMNLESLREAAFLAHKSLAEEKDGVENFVVEITKSWQTLSVQSSKLLRDVDMLILDRESGAALNAQFSKLMDSLIEGEGCNKTPLGIKCQLRSHTLVRRLRLWEKLPIETEKRLIQDSVDDVSALLDLYIEYFSYLWTAASTDLRICTDLENCPMTGSWTRENCVKQLEACQIAIRELNLFAINTKCKAAQEQKCSNGGLLSFCGRASAVINACIKLHTFFVPAVAIRSGTVLPRVYETLHEFVETKYLGGIWSEKLNDAYVSWILWFLEDSGWLVNGWMNDRQLFPFREVWREGIHQAPIILRPEELLSQAFYGTDTHQLKRHSSYSYITEGSEGSEDKKKAAAPSSTNNPDLDIDDPQRQESSREEDNSRRGSGPAAQHKLFGTNHRHRADRSSLNCPPSNPDTDTRFRDESSRGEVVIKDDEANKAAPPSNPDEHRHNTRFLNKSSRGEGKLKDDGWTKKKKNAPSPRYIAYEKSVISYPSGRTLTLKRDEKRLEDTTTTTTTTRSFPSTLGNTSASTNEGTEPRIETPSNTSETGGSECDHVNEGRARDHPTLGEDNQQQQHTQQKSATHAPQKNQALINHRKQQQGCTQKKMAHIITKEAVHGSNNNHPPSPKSIHITRASSSPSSALTFRQKVDKFNNINKEKVEKKNGGYSTSAHAASRPAYAECYIPVPSKFADGERLMTSRNVQIEAFIS